MSAIAEVLGQHIGLKQACAVLDVPRSRLYRARLPEREPSPRPQPAAALSSDEREQVRQTLNSQRFADQAPRQVYAALLDEGAYLCHWRTMYRVLAKHDEVRERRNLLTHPTYHKPELLASAPNQVWSWDITKLLGPAKWTYYYLYVILDIFSRYVVGWMLAEREAAVWAKQLIEETLTKEKIQPGQLAHDSLRQWRCDEGHASSEPPRPPRRRQELQPPPRE